jgi:hypothetical protein
LLSFVPQAFLDCQEWNIVVHFRPIQTKPLHFREGMVNVTRPDCQVLHHHQLSIFPEPVAGQVDTKKTTSRFNCQERQIHNKSIACSSPQGNDWCFLRPIWTNPRHWRTTTTTHSHNQSQPLSGSDQTGYMHYRGHTSDSNVLGSWQDQRTLPQRLHA